VKFLEANQILQDFKGKETIPIRLCMSGAHQPMELFVKAEAAKHDKLLNLLSIPPGTLQQHLMTGLDGKDIEIYLLFPWDLCCELDWRTGVNAPTVSPEGFLLEASALANRLKIRKYAHLFYVPASIPPVFPNLSVMTEIATGLDKIMRGIGAHFLDPEVFDFGNFLNSSFPISGRAVGEVAKYAIDAAFQCEINIPPYVPRKAEVFNSEPGKVLVTDLDNTLWDGILGEDEPGCIRFEPEGRGFKHFVYQTFLRKLKNEGTLLAAVTRNDPEDVDMVMASDRMVLSQMDFVAVIASYNAKSAQIRMLSEKLNLGSQEFIFVDDNPIDLAEVKPYLGASRCIAFPEKDNQIPQFINLIAEHFPRTKVTDEDKERTLLYRQQFKIVAPNEDEGEDLTTFLKTLKMKLTILDRSTVSYERCIQLINKTNQFNLNGCRLSEAQIAGIINEGGCLYGATLEDRTGNHGEILACLINSQGIVESFVLSCRVFERQVEYGFTCWLLAKNNAPLRLMYQKTNRNEPIRRFLKNAGCELGGNGLVSIDPKAFRRLHRHSLKLLKLRCT